MWTKYTWIMDAIKPKSEDKVFKPLTSENKVFCVARNNMIAALAELDKHPSYMVYEVDLPDVLNEQEKSDTLFKFVELVAKEGVTIQFLDTHRFILYNKDFLA